MHYLAAKASVAKFAVYDRLSTRLQRRDNGMETIESPSSSLSSSSWPSPWQPPSAHSSTAR